MPRYLMLLHENPAECVGMSPDEIQRIIEKYRAWSEAVAGAGRLVGGEKLRDDGGCPHLDGGRIELREIEPI